MKHPPLKGPCRHLISHITIKRLDIPTSSNFWDFQIKLKPAKTYSNNLLHSIEMKIPSTFNHFHPAFLTQAAPYPQSHLPRASKPTKPPRVTGPSCDLAGGNLRGTLWKTKVGWTWKTPNQHSVYMLETTNIHVQYENSTLFKFGMLENVGSQLIVDYTDSVQDSQPLFAHLPSFHPHCLFHRNLTGTIRMIASIGPW